MDDFFRVHWRGSIESRVHLRGQGGICIRRVQSRIQVSSPYHVQFRDGVRKIGGYWRKRSSMWSIPDDVETELRALLKECYGYEWK